MPGLAGPVIQRHEARMMREGIVEDPIHRTARVQGR